MKVTTQQHRKISNAQDLVSIANNLLMEVLKETGEINEEGSYRISSLQKHLLEVEKELDLIRTHSEVVTRQDEAHGEKVT